MKGERGKFLKKMVGSLLSLTRKHSLSGFSFFVEGFFSKLKKEKGNEELCKRFLKGSF